jgi:pimeloyl-ACP methyl ester carboxylesterase
MVKEAGHMLPIEKPEVCARLVQGFLSGLNR